MPANYQRWAQAQEWAISDAALLLLGIEPTGEYPPVNLKPAERISYEKILRAASQDLGDKLPTAWHSRSAVIPGSPKNYPHVKVTPGDWISWAIRRRLVKRDDIKELLSHCSPTELNTKTLGKARSSNEDKRDFQQLALPMLNGDSQATYEELIRKSSALRAYRRMYRGRDTLRNWMREIDPYLGGRRIGRPKK